MTSEAYTTYTESRIGSAGPEELVQILYEAAIAAVRDARAALERRDIGGRARAVSKAVAILAELGASLSPNAGGDLSQKLAALYDYMQRRLLAANFQQVDQPLAEVQGLLETLAEAWNALVCAGASSSHDASWEGADRLQAASLAAVTAEPLLNGSGGHWNLRL